MLRQRAFWNTQTLKLLWMYCTPPWTTPTGKFNSAVMQSRGNLTNQHQWRPDSIDSDSHRDACINHWREFEKQSKTVAQ